MAIKAIRPDRQAQNLALAIMASRTRNIGVGEAREFSSRDVRGTSRRVGRSRYQLVHQARSQTSPGLDVLDHADTGEPALLEHPT
jgi:hypothetical protein